MTLPVDLFGRPVSPRSPQHQQLPLPLHWRDCSGGNEDMLIGAANRQAVDALNGWRDWLYPIAVLYGPPRSGKSALARWFRRRAETSVVIDPATGSDELVCFHACNRALAGDGPLLLTVAGGVGSWLPALADLATRVRAGQQLEIGVPDAAFFAALIERRVADAALYLPKEAARYIAERSERSYLALDACAERLVQHARLTGQRLTLPLVRDIMAAADAHGAERIWAAR